MYGMMEPNVLKISSVETVRPTAACRNYKVVRVPRLRMSMTCSLIKTPFHFQKPYQPPDDAFHLRAAKTTSSLDHHVARDADEHGGTVDDDKSK